MGVPYGVTDTLTCGGGWEGPYSVEYTNNETTLAHSVGER